MLTVSQGDFCAKSEFKDVLLTEENVVKTRMILISGNIVPRSSQEWIEWEEGLKSIWLFFNANVNNTSDIEKKSALTEQDIIKNVNQQKIRNFDANICFACVNYSVSKKNDKK